MDKNTFIKNIIAEELVKKINEIKFAQSQMPKGLGLDFDDMEDDSNSGMEPGANNRVAKTKTGGDRMTATGNALRTMHGDGRLQRYVDSDGKEMSGVGKMLDDFFVDPDVYSSKSPKEKDKYNPDVFGTIKVTMSTEEPANKDYKVPHYIVSYYNVRPEDTKFLAQHLNDLEYTLWITVPQSRMRFGKCGATFIVDSKYMDKWKEIDLPKIIGFLKSQNSDGRYGTDADFDNLLKATQITTRTQKDIEGLMQLIKANNIQWMKSIMAAQNDAELQTLIKAYERNGVAVNMCMDLNLPQSYGHILSRKNQQAIAGTGRSATFILPEKTWKRVFGRVVDPTAEPFYITIPNIKNWNGEWKNPSSFNYEYNDNGERKTVLLTSTQDILNTFYGGKPYESLDDQERFYVNCLANVNNVKGMFRIPEYDVADTKWDPNLNPVDVFNETIGLSNNITGELNDKAKAAMVNRQGEIEKSQAELDSMIADGGELAPESSDAELANIQANTRIAKDNVLSYAKLNGIKLNIHNTEPSLVLIEALLQIADPIIEKKTGWTRKNFKDKIAGNVVYLACLAEHVALDRLNSFNHGLDIKDDEADQCMTVFGELIDAMEGYSIGKVNGKVALEEEDNNENGELAGLAGNEQAKENVFYSLLNKLTQQKMMESFNDLLESMDKSKKNLIY